MAHHKAVLGSCPPKAGTDLSGFGCPEGKAETPHRSPALAEEKQSHVAADGGWVPSCPAVGPGNPSQLV